MDFNMADMFGKIAEMQKQMQQTQEELAKQTVTTEVGGGLVSVTANGAQRITAIKIDPTAVTPDDAEMLEDLILAGVNKALEEASGLAQSAMQKQAGSMLPPGMDLSKFGL
jgi:DNA-binding YbaB/EbfC family protein